MRSRKKPFRPKLEIPSVSNKTETGAPEPENDTVNILSLRSRGRDRLILGRSTFGLAVLVQIPVDFVAPLNTDISELDTNFKMK